MYEAGIRESDTSGRDSLIFSVTQPVSYPFAHVSCKVKFFGKVANVYVTGLEGETIRRQCSFNFRSTKSNQLSCSRVCIDCGSRTQSMKSCHEETISFKAP